MLNKIIIGIFSIFFLVGCVNAIPSVIMNETQNSSLSIIPTVKLLGNISIGTGGITNVTNGTLYHNLLFNLNWSSANHPMDAPIRTQEGIDLPYPAVGTDSSLYYIFTNLETLAGGLTYRTYFNYTQMKIVQYFVGKPVEYSYIEPVANTYKHTVLNGNFTSNWTIDGQRGIFGNFTVLQNLFARWISGNYTYPTGSHTLYVCKTGCNYTNTTYLNYEFGTPSATNPYVVKLGCGQFANFSGPDYVSLVGESSKCSEIKLNNKYNIPANNMLIENIRVGIPTYAEYSINFANSVENVTIRNSEFYAGDTDVILFGTGKVFRNILIENSVIDGTNGNADGFGIQDDCSNCRFSNSDIYIGNTLDIYATCVYAGANIGNKDPFIYDGIRCFLNGSKQDLASTVNAYEIYKGNHIIKNNNLNVYTNVSFNSRFAGIYCKDANVTVIGTNFNVDSAYLENNGIIVDDGCDLWFGSGNTFSDSVDYPINLTGGTVHYLNQIIGNLNVTGNLNVIKNTTFNTYFAEVYYYNFSVGTAVPINQTYQTMRFENSTNGTTLNGFKYWYNGQMQLIDGEGMYNVKYSMTGSGTQNHIYIGAIFVDNTEQQNTKSTATGQASNEVQIDGFGFIRVSLGSNVTLRLKDISGSQTGTYREGRFDLMRIGN